MNKMILIMFLLSLCESIFSQSIFEKEINNWLEKKSNDKINFIRVLSITNELDYPIKDKELKLCDGVYEFYDVRSHSEIYLFIFKNDKIDFITNYEVSNLLEIYWNMKEKMKNDKERLKLLEGISNVIYQRSKLFTESGLIDK